MLWKVCIHPAFLITKSLIRMRVAFWAAFTTDSNRAPVDHTGLMWPMYTGRNGSMVVFGDGVGSQVKPLGAMEEVYPLEEC
jgi:hypothetical protein